MATGLVWDERFAWHDAGLASTNPWAEPYPALDRPQVKRRLWALLQASGLAERLVSIPARPATDDELLRFHTAAYIDRIRSMAATGGGDAGESARFGRNGFEIARLAAGGCIAAVEAVLQRRVENAYALVRPSGHHAEPDRGRGFCIFGNIVLAVEHARRVHGVERIAVVDWDVHHGNGTQMAYYADPNVLTISLHQEAYYPMDSGDLSETGDGAGRGANINIPLPPGKRGRRLQGRIRSCRHPSGDGFSAGAHRHCVRLRCGGQRSVWPDVMPQRDLPGDDRCGCAIGALAVRRPPYRLPGRRLFADLCALLRPAVIEALSDEVTEVVDPMLGWYSSLGGQQLQPHQEKIIDAAAALLKVPAEP